MKLKPVKLQVVESKPAKTQRSTGGDASAHTKKQKLPPDTYKPMIESKELQISDTAKLIFSVSRKGEYGLPHIDIRLYVTSPQYTGLTTKGINFDTEYLYDFMEIIAGMNKELESKGV